MGTFATRISAGRTSGGETVSYLEQIIGQHVPVFWGDGYIRCRCSKWSFSVKAEEMARSKDWIAHISEALMPIVDAATADARSECPSCKDWKSAYMGAHLARVATDKLLTSERESIRALAEKFVHTLREVSMISQDQLDNWFTYHSPSPDQLPKYLAIREAGKAFASAIVSNSPDCADTTAAMRKVREAVMTANQAIACGGK